MLPCLYLGTIWIYMELSNNQTLHVWHTYLHWGGFRGQCRCILYSIQGVCGICVFVYRTAWNGRSFFLHIRGYPWALIHSSMWDFSKEPFSISALATRRVGPRWSEDVVGSIGGPGLLVGASRSGHRGPGDLPWICLLSWEEPVRLGRMPRWVREKAPQGLPVL